jgi:hypothetical protein
MSYIPDQFVRRCIIAIVQGNGQLHNAKARSKMPAAFTYDIKHEFPDFRGKYREIFFGQFSYVFRKMY